MPIHVALLGAALSRRMASAIQRGSSTVLANAKQIELWTVSSMELATTEEGAHHILAMPVAPPDAPARLFACHMYTDLSFGNAYPVALQEPCGLTPDACCALAHDHNHTAAWHLSPSGCCTLLEVPEAEWADLAAQTTTPMVVGQTVRPVVEVSGARTALPAAYLVGG